MPVARPAFFFCAITLAVGATIAASGRAQPIINASPSWVPLGVSASGANSTAWFHEPSSRQVVACRTLEGSGSNAGTVQCTVGKLP